MGRIIKPASGLVWPGRWYPLIPHPEQVRLLTENKRFAVVPAGRRSGKTERAKRKLVKEAMRRPGLYFAAAPTRQQAKNIYWRDLKELVPAWFKGRRPSESELIVYLKNGAEIHVIGLDKPERFEGIPWTWGVIDEIANVKEDAWRENIRPALSTKGLNTGAWLIGVPEGLNHYYDLAEEARTGGDPEWGLYTWKSIDILDPKEIASARRRLDPRTFRQEYEASFETATGRIYDMYDDGNLSDMEMRQGRTIVWCHDFNFVPLSSAIIQAADDGTDHVVDEIVLEHAVAQNAADEFVERYRDDYAGHPVLIYGDASGHAGQKHGHASDYSVLEKTLTRAGFRVEMNVPAANPAIRDGQTALRGRILNAERERHLFVNKAKAPTVDRGLRTTQTMKGSAYQEDESNRNQHITTALRYWAYQVYPPFGEAQVENF